MIVTVTMNPALDKTVDVDTLVPKALNRLLNVRVDPGGKGVNVSKIIKVLGGSSVATGFVGGETGRELKRLIDSRGLIGDFIEVDGTTRTNLKVVDKDSSLTELNEPGIKVTAEEISRLLKKIKDLAGSNGLVVLSGSLPREAPEDTYKVLAQQLALAGAKVIIDADGPSFRAGLMAPPYLVKPNRFEILQYFGLSPTTSDQELWPLAQKLLDLGLSFVIVSLGSDGAMFVTKEKRALVRTVPVSVRSTVGAGDSLVGAAALAIESGLNFEQTVRLCMAASVGAVTTEGTNPPTLDLIRELEPKFELTFIN
ncbi:MAG: 1-phosphofructokinase [Deltaproteobacteria bacterium]|jgi:1-phosphofructokinase|nr:1-phosphofructokinase [Deltaproteobacteria bacterium]